MLRVVAVQTAARHEKVDLLQVRRWMAFLRRRLRKSSTRLDAAPHVILPQWRARFFHPEEKECLCLCPPAASARQRVQGLLGLYGVPPPTMNRCTGIATALPLLTQTRERERLLYAPQPLERQDLVSFLACAQPDRKHSVFV